MMMKFLPHFEPQAPNFSKISIESILYLHKKLKDSALCPLIVTRTFLERRNIDT